MRTHRFRTIAAGACASALLTVAACGGGDDEAGGGTTTADPSASSTDAPNTTLDPAAQAEADVRAAYDAYWAMNERLAAAPDPQDPEIAERTTGGARDALTTLLTQFLTEGYVLEFQADYGHEVLSVEVGPEGTTAQLQDCYIDHALRRSAESGNPEGEATTTFHIDVSLVIDADAWKVEHIEELDSWEGMVSCG